MLAWYRAFRKESEEEKAMVVGGVEAIEKGRWQSAEGQVQVGAERGLSDLTWESSGKTRAGKVGTKRRDVRKFTGFCEG